MRARATTSLLGGVVAAIELARAPVPTTLLGVAGYVAGGAAVAACWLLAAYYWARAQRAPE